MARIILSLSACALLIACGDPLAKVDKLSSVDVAEADPVLEVAATEQKNPKGGFFSRLRGGNQTAETTVQSVDDAALTETLDVAGEVQTTSEPDAINAAAVAAVPEKKRSGLFGFMRAKEAAPAASLQTAQTADQSQDLVEPAKAEVVTTQTAALETSTEQAKPKRGFLGLLSGARSQDRAQGDVESVQTASLGPVTAPQAPEKKSLFAKGSNNHKGPDKQIVPFGSVLPSGAIARVCDLPSGRLGKQVGKFPERGSGYKMFDSAPTSSAPRPFYITGFGDKCARTFTAALALFGSPSMHEQLRYGLPSQVQPYSTTDKAYEGIKRAVCGVGKRKPCGSKIKLLEKNTVFISIYDRFGSNASWSNVLLHKGWVLAADRKG